MGYISGAIFDHQHRRNDLNSNSQKLNREGLFHLLIVYILWGSTYLGIRVAVREGAGFPPFTLAFMRVMVAAAILLAMARWRGERIKLDRA